MKDEDKNTSNNTSNTIVTDNNLAKFIIDDNLFSQKTTDIGLVKSIDEILINSANNKPFVVSDYQIDNDYYSNSKTFINCVPASIPAFKGTIEQLQQFPTIEELKQNQNTVKDHEQNDTLQENLKDTFQESTDTITQKSTPTPPLQDENPFDSKSNVTFNQENVIEAPQENIATYTSYANNIFDRQEPSFVNNDTTQDEFNTTQGDKIKDDIKLNMQAENLATINTIEQDSKTYKKHSLHTPVYEQKSKQTFKVQDKKSLNIKHDSKNLSSIFLIELYIRQLIAAPFSFSTISNIFSKTANVLGPSYPSSAMLAFLVISTIATIPCILFDHSNSYSRSLLSLILFLCYTSLTGFEGYRGICSFISRLSKRKPDGITYAMSSLMPSFLFVVTFYSLSFSTSTITALFVFIIATVVSAAFAYTLSFDIEQDPVSSTGKISISGVIFSCIVACALAFFSFNYIVACTIIGLSALSRLIASIYFSKVKAFASKQNTQALHIIITQIIMLTLNILSLHYYLLNSYVYFYLNKLL